MEIPEPIKCDLEKVGGINGLINDVPKDAKIQNLTKIFHGLSDKYRLKILIIINKQPVCVCILKEILKIADSKLSYHLSSLKEYGLIYGKQQGNWIIYYPTKLGKMVLGLINDNLSNL
jgi:ArsR family transcriptional regulator